MRIIKKIPKDKIFIRFLISYISVLFIPLFIGIFAYKESITVVEQDAREATLASLKRCMIALDGRLAEVENIANQLTMDPNLLSFAREWNPSIDPTVPCKINDLKEKILPFTKNNNFISMMYVYFKKSDVAFLNSKSYLFEEDLYGDFFQYNNMNNIEWHEKIINRKQYRSYFPEAPVRWISNYDAGIWKEQSMIMYMQSFPLGSFDKGQVMFLIPTSKIQELLSDIISSQQGYVYITDSKNNVLASFSAPEKSIDLKNLELQSDSGLIRQKISSQDMIVVHSTSKFNGWRYISVIPYKVVTQRVEHLRKLIYFMLSISLIVGILGAFIMAHSNSKPIKSIIDIFKDMFNESDLSNYQQDYSYLRKSILNLVSNNKSMETSLNTQIQMLKTVFVEKLISGRFSSLEEVRFYLEQIEMKVFHGKIAVVIAHVKPINGEQNNYILQEFSAIKIVVKNLIEKYIGNEVYYHELDFDKGVIIFNVSEDCCQKPKDYVEEILNHISMKLYESQNIHVSFASGSFAENYLGVSQSLEEAKDAMEYNNINAEKHVLWHCDVPKRNECYYYPVDTEMLLINYTKFGNVKEVRRILKRIYKENFEKDTKSAAVLIYLINEIQGTILKTINMLLAKHKESFESINSKLSMFEECQSPEKAFTFAIGIFEEICCLASEEKNNKTDTMSNILNYLSTNYMDPQLSLTSLADRYNFAPAYLSQLFKEESGVNFSIYLEKIRIKKACELLQTGGAVNKIASSVGYNDVHSFRNAFKRTIGVTPRDYKERAEGKESLEL
jgi:two-component system, response regulator YesN